MKNQTDLSSKHTYTHPTQHTYIHKHTQTNKQTKKKQTLIPSLTYYNLQLVVSSSHSLFPSKNTKTSKEKNLNFLRRNIDAFSKQLHLFLLK